jgi:hypothetical protein
MILIAFRHGDDRLFSRLVTFFRGGDCAHVEAAIPAEDGHLTLCVSSSFVDGGVRGKVIDITSPHKWRVYRWEAWHPELLEWLKPRMRVGYDLRGLAGIPAPRIGHDLDKMFCSEAVAHILGLIDPHTYDLVRLESHIAQAAPLVVWSGLSWVDAKQPHTAS